MTRLAPMLLVAFLLAGTAVAFAVTQGLKLERSPIYGVKFDRVLGPHQGAHLRFKLRKADTITVTVVDASGHTVARLFDGPRRRGTVWLRWNGRTDAGALAPEGTYLLRVRLASRHGTIQIPTEFRLDATPPQLTGVTAHPRVFSPDGDGRADGVVLGYATNKPGQVILTVNGRRAVLTRRRVGARPFTWNGKVNGRTVPPGRYVLRLRAVDLVGNRSARSRPLAVTLRYLRITTPTILARAGKRFRVPLDTDYRKVSWQFAGRSGVARAHPLRLRAPKTRGAVALVVHVDGHAARATVLVGVAP